MADPCLFLNHRFKDFGLSYAKNGELLKYIRKIGSFDETCTRFYSAEIVCALEYLHNKGIIHRYEFIHFSRIVKHVQFVAYLVFILCSNIVPNFQRPET